MSQNFNTCFREPDGTDVSLEFVEKRYLLDVYPNLINPMKAPAFWIWGYSSILGDNSTVNKSSPVQTISSGTNWKQVCFSRCHAVAVKTDGTLWTWGSGSYGELGNNSVAGSLSPVQTVGAATNWKQVSAGGSSAFAPFSAGIKSDGTLWTWGNNADGQLGNNSRLCRSSPVQTFSGGTNWKQVSAGRRTMAAIKTDASLWLWGFGGYGSLGNQSILSRSSPVQTISAGTNWRQVSSGDATTAAIKTDGSLWLWGFGDGGGLGNNCAAYGTGQRFSSPVQTVSGGTNWKQVSMSIFSARGSAIKTDGSLWVWGAGAGGALGNGSTQSVSSPVQTISGGTNWKKVATGYSSTSAIKTDGSLWIWGCGTYFGILGTNASVSHSSPVQTIINDNSWKDIVIGYGNAGGIREEGDW